ncbi:hypothetical protein [Bifidobacterium callitrichidarum]|uniref:hypothetical protein n=1 Tax=Bifidobacterium callitrichidarum TaxID=2052941 RepID=UPI0011B28A05|nr:hypothetical protein [Bifidobacterium callitrichidarum]
MTQPLPPITQNYTENRNTPSTLIAFRIPQTWKPIIQQDAKQHGMALSEYIRYCLSQQHEHLTEDTNEPNTDIS